MRREFLQKSFPALALILCLLAGPTAYGALTQKTMISDSLRFMAPGGALNNPQVVIDNVNAGNETPQVSNASQGTPAGSGFKWGGYYSGTATGQGLKGLGTNVNLTSPIGGASGSNAYGIMLLYNHVGGQYAYTLFDSNGGNTPDQYVDLSGNTATASFYHVASGTLTDYPFKARFMLHSNVSNQWYVSDPVTLPQAKTTAVRIAVIVSGPSATKWYAVDSAVNSNLNLLAAGDEMPLSFATTASAPNFTKVDGGGLFIESGGPDTNATAYKPTLPTWIADDATVKPGLKATATPSYPRDNTQLVLGPSGSPNPTNGAINLAAAGLASLTITKIQLNDPASQFSLGSLPSLPLTVSSTASTTLTVAWNPPPVALTDSNSSASLMVTCDAGGVPGTVVYVPIVGRLIKNVTIKESFNNPVNQNMASWRPSNQAPQQMYAPVTDTGFKWGGFTNATATGGLSRHMVGMNNNRLVFYGGGADDAHTGGNYHGSYAYTIFDSMGGTTPDYAIKLDKIQINPDQAAAGQQIRFLIRDTAGFWYLSNTVVNITATATTQDFLSFDLGGYTWKRVDAAAEGYMNRMAVEDQVPMAEPATLAAATPNLNSVTGVGIYVETGETSDAQQTALTVPDLNLIIQPSNNDRLAIKTKNTVTSNTEVVPYKRIGLMAIDCAVTSGMEVALSGLDVTVNSTAGLNTLYLYSDPNVNGLPDDGAVLSSCVVSGTSAKLTFRSPQVVQKGVPVDFALVGLFDNTATSKTYTLTVAANKWSQDTAAGGTGDQITQTPDPATVNVQINPVALPDILSNPTTTPFEETWENVAVGPLPTTPASGPVTGADYPWTYNFTGGTAVKMPAAFIKDGSSVVGGVETKSMTSEVTPYDAGFYFRNDRTSAIPFDSRYIQMMKLDFTAVVTSTTLAALSPHYSSRLTGDYSNFGIRLNPSSGSAYGVTFYPLTDADRSFFAVTAGGTAEYAPGNILAFSNGNGTGHYQCSAWFAPTFGTPAMTTVKLDIKHVESGKTASWMTQVDGSAANLKSVDLWFGPWSNVYFDNVKLTAYQYFVNPVRSWTLFQ